jgi:hypothetical protein
MRLTEGIALHSLTISPNAPFVSRRGIVAARNYSFTTITSETGHRSRMILIIIIMENIS